MLTDAALQSGQSQVAITIHDAHGEHTFLTEAMDGGWSSLHPPDDDGPFWSSRLPLPCSPEAAVQPQFTTSLRVPLGGGAAEVVFEPGVYPIRNIGIDVPAREQGATDTWFDGDITVTDETDCHISGYLTGRGGGTLMSYLTQESYDFEFIVEGASFRDLDVYYCAEE
ncbi:MAG: hypothetical protein D6798_05640 [Deltaproteobacteria bacterium]|nr:MAG: hypothetical protein D6798_05640 [Deltaproteobacteria bacterium]